MSKWSTNTLAELAAPGRSIISGPFGSSIGSKFFVESGVPVIRGNNLTKGKAKFIDAGFVFLTPEKAKELNAYAEQGDIVFTAAGTIGQVGIIPEDARFTKYVISNKQIRVRLDTSKIMPEFAYTVLAEPSMIKLIETFNTGSTIPLINLSIVKSISVPVPPADVQLSVMQIMSTWREYSAALEKLIACAVHFHAALAQYLLTPAMDMNSEQWETVALGAIAQIKTGKKDNQDKVADGLYPFYVRSPVVERIDTYAYDGEAILVPGEGNIGKIFHYINGRFDYHQRVYKISDFAPNVSGRYIYHYLRTHFARQAARDSAKAAVDSLRLPTFVNFTVKIPPLLRQEVIASSLDTSMRRILLLQNKKQLIDKERTYLLKQFLNGGIPVPEILAPLATELVSPPAKTKESV